MKPDLAELVARWQGLLRLRDWDLEVRYVTDLKSGDGRPCHGLCSRFVDAKRARILIRDPETSAPLGEAYDVEDTIIHELLHLHWAPLAEDTPAGIAAEEQAVWAIAGALTALGKDSGQSTRLARVFVDVAANVSAARRGRQKGMDPILIAALKAAIASGDMKQIEALVAGLEGQPTGGGEGEQPAAEQGAAPAGEEQKPAAKQVQRAQGAPPAAATTAPTRPQFPASMLATRAQVAELERRNVELERKIERVGIERLLDRRPDLDDAKRAYLLGSTYEQAERYLKAHPALDEAGAPAAATQRAQRGTSPTVGAKGPGESPNGAFISRAMGMPEAPAQAIGRDAAGRLTISNIARNPVVRDDGKGGAK